MGEPADEQWAGMRWAPWQEFDDAAVAVAVASAVPASPGIYRFRTHGEQNLLYIGIGADRRRRLRTLRRWSRKGSHAFMRRLGEKRPFRGHYAAPALARCEEAGYCVEVSWPLGIFPDRQERENVERTLIEQHRRETGKDPAWQYGGRGVESYLANKSLPAGPEGSRLGCEQAHRIYGARSFQDRPGNRLGCRLGRDVNE